MRWGRDKSLSLLGTEHGATMLICKWRKYIAVMAAKKAGGHYHRQAKNP